jgi:hypothetical protein
MNNQLHTFPDAREIVTAVREFLADQVVPHTTGSLSFHARVAANLMATLERELLAGDHAASMYFGALAELGAANEDELAMQIRAGQIGLGSRALLEALTMATDERLRVSNPTYLADPGDDDPRADGRTRDAR